MRRIQWIFLLGIFFLLAFSCTEKIRKGEPITASGFVTDTVKKKRLAGVKVYLVGGNYFHTAHTSGWDWARRIDSVLTDINGNYSFTYVADGACEDYAVSIEPTIHDNNAPVTNDGYPVYAFLKKAEIRNQAIYARELEVAKIHLKINDNPYDTLILDFYNYTHSRKNFFLVGKRIDTTLFLKTLVAKAPNLIYYKLTYPRITAFMHQGLSEVVMRDSVFPDLNDTTFIEKTIASSKQLITQSPFEFTVGGNTNNDALLDSIRKNPVLHPNDTSLKIISFALTIKMKNYEGKNTYRKNLLPKALIAHLPAFSRGDSCYFYFENVMALTKSGDTTRLNDMWLRIKK